MDYLSKQSIDAFRRELSSDAAIGDAAMHSIGGHLTLDAAWRFYSSNFPLGGLIGWNGGAWRGYWPDLSSSVTFIGEDVFGNQVACVGSDDTVFLWNHENGSLVSTELDLTTLLAGVLEAGVGWLDFYQDASLAVAREYLGALEELSLQQHLHWTTPLALNGPLSVSNLTLIDRDPHLVGHGKLWAQVSTLPPGTDILLR